MICSFKQRLLIYISSFSKRHFWKSSFSNDIFKTELLQGKKYRSSIDTFYIYRYQFFKTIPKQLTGILVSIQYRYFGFYRYQSLKSIPKQLTGNLVSIQYRYFYRYRYQFLKTIPKQLIGNLVSIQYRYFLKCIDSFQKYIDT